MNTIFKHLKGSWPDFGSDIICYSLLFYMKGIIRRVHGRQTCLKSVGVGGGALAQRSVVNYLKSVS